MKANTLSLTFKIIGAAVILVTIILKGFGIWDISMNEVLVGVTALAGLVLPIDISKIKEVGHDKV